MREFLDSLPPVVLPLLLFYFFCLAPLRKVRRARSWRKTPCVIVSSAVDEDATDSGLYSIFVAYRYDAAGQPHIADRYSFSPATATAGSWLKKRAASRLSPGIALHCYVNPDDPEDAVLEPGVTWDMVFMGLLAVAFLAGFLFLWSHGRIR